MSRPPKYPTPMLAAEAYVISKVLPTANIDVDLITVATQKCHICSAKPMELMHVTRTDGEYNLWYNRVVKDKPVCKMCFALTKIATMKEVRSYAARIMAMRKHELDMKPFNTIPD